MVRMGSDYLNEICKGKSLVEIILILEKEEEKVNARHSEAFAKQNGISLASYVSDIKRLQSVLIYKNHNNNRTLKIFEPIFKNLVARGEMKSELFEEIMAV